MPDAMKDAATHTQDYLVRADVAAIEAMIQAEEGRLQAHRARHPVRALLARIGWAAEFVKRESGSASRIAALRARLAQPLRDAGYCPRPTGMSPGMIPHAKDKPVTIIITVFEALEALRACLASVLRCTSAKHRILILDDASTDARIERLSRAMAKRHPQVSYFRQPERLGYTRNANAGLALAEGDVILLQSDTRVTPGWLTKLRETAHSAPDIATVTALSTAAGHCSFLATEQFNVMPEGINLTELASMVERIGAGCMITTLTGHGFCLYLRRDALTALGYFDEAAFPYGDGQVSDFCQRAIGGNWRNTIDPRVLVFHRNAGSQDDRKMAQLAHGKASMARLHPEYERELAAWLQDDPLNALRVQLRACIEQLQSSRRDASPASDKPALLLVVFAGGGGTPKTNIDLARGLCATWRVLLLVMAADEWTLSEITSTGSQVVLDAVFFPSVVAIEDALPSGHAAQLSTWIARHAVRLVHFRHWLGTSPEIVTIARESGVKVVVSLHDFYSVCPALNLVDASGVCCLGDCEAHAMPADHDCTAIESWSGQAAGVWLRGGFVSTWRKRVSAAIAPADAIVTTAASARDIIARTQPEIASRITIIEHGRDFDSATSDGIAAFSPARFVFLGEATFVKGADFVVELARRAFAAGRVGEFHLVGKAFIEVPTLPNLIAHGSYERDALRSTLAQLQPTLILLPSRFPETYCHTLTEAWSCGVPVLAHRIGALEERVLQHGGGWLADSLDVDSWLLLLDEIMNDRAAWEDKVQSSRAANIRSVEAMTQDYRQLYESLMSSER